MEFPTIDKFANEVAEKALDEITYEGKTIREWAEIITKQQPCEDCISRSEALKHTHIEYDDDGVGHKVVYAEDIEELPSVTPQQNVGKWLNNTDEDAPWFVCSECGAEFYECGKYCTECGSYNGGEKDEWF